MSESRDIVVLVIKGGCLEAALNAIAERGFRQSFEVFPRGRANGGTAYDLRMELPDESRIRDTIIDFLRSPTFWPYRAV